MRIKNDCAETPVGLLWHVRRALSWINQADLSGIDYVWLIDEIPHDILSTHKDWQQLESEGQRILGFYMRRHGDAAPFVALVVKRPYELLPLPYRFTPVTTVLLAHTLAHEVGHHLIATRGYVFEPGEKYGRAEFEEEFADRYAVEVIKRMRRRWYYRLGLRGVRDLAEWQYIFGLLDWRDKRYKEAAEHWQKSACLNPENPETVYWHYRAKDLAQAETSASPEANEHATR